MKIRLVGAELFHAHGRHDEANSHFLQCCERAKTLDVLPRHCVYVFCV